MAAGLFPWLFNVSLDGLAQGVLSFGADVCMVFTWGSSVWCRGSLCVADDLCRLPVTVCSDLCCISVLSDSHAVFSILYSLLIFIVTAELTKDADHFRTDNQPYVGGGEVASSVPGWKFRKPICLCFSYWFVAAFLFRLGGYVSFCWLCLLLFSVNPMGCLFLFLVFLFNRCF